MSKAKNEFDICNYQRCIQILKEEAKLYPRSLDAFRLTLKAYMRLYEIDKAEECYSKFFT